MSWEIDLVLQGMAFSMDSSKATPSCTHGRCWLTLSTTLAARTLSSMWGCLSAIAMYATIAGVYHCGPPSSYANIIT